MMPKTDLPNSKGFNPFAHLIGLNFTKFENGWTHCTLNVTDQLLNPYNVLHGGVIYSMADTGMGGALFSVLEPGQTCTTVEIKVSYFKFVTSGTLTCESKIINKGRKIATLESEITNKERLVAKAIGTFYILEIAGK